MHVRTGIFKGEQVMRKNQAFLFATFTVLLAFIFVMIAAIGFKMGTIINGFYNGSTFSFEAFLNYPKYYFPLSASVVSIYLGVVLSLLPMLCAFAFLIVSFFKKKFIFGVYAAVIISLIVLSLGYAGFLISNLVGIILNDASYFSYLFDSITHISLNFETIYRFVSMVIAYIAIPILHLSITWIPFVAFLLFCLSLITIASKEPYAKKGEENK